MECTDGISEEWGSYDILFKEKIKIEVKTSAYLQTWAHKELSEIRFSISQSRAWISDTNELEKELKRQADIYVFCVENHKVQETLNPLDLNQWDFYPVLTSTLNEKVGKQKSICLNSLLKIGAKPYGFDELKEVIIKMVV